MNLRHILQSFSYSQFHSLMQLQPFASAIGSGEYEEALQIAGEILL